MANTLNIHNYSAIVAIGGDGTVHEVANGMLHRADKKTVPMAFIPAGSGNDFCSSLYIKDLNKALDYIVKGDVVRMDTSKVLIDYDREEDIPVADRPTNLRYMLINCNFAVAARVAHRAISFKNCCCGNAYEMAAVIEFMKIKEDKFDVYLDE